MNETEVGYATIVKLTPATTITVVPLTAFGLFYSLLSVAQSSRPQSVVCGNRSCLCEEKSIPAFKLLNHYSNLKIYLIY